MFFIIDHPLDPANVPLSHSSVESPEMKNVDDGVATLNAGGKAEIKLPAWFQVVPLLAGDRRPPPEVPDSAIDIGRGRPR